MKKVFISLILIICLVIPVSAEEFTAPPVPDSGAYLFPEEPESFGEGLWAILQDALPLIQPAVAEGAAMCLALIACAILASMIASVPEASKQVIRIVSSIAVATLLLQPSHALLRLSVDTVHELSEYGKLLLPVMTAVVAAQGGATTSTALYVGTAAFDAILTTAIEKLIVPMLYIYLCLAVANSAMGQDLVKKLRDFVKWLMTWCLKIILYIFIGYIGVTGVVSGAADAAAVKAAKLTISGVVPVVGSILADASETILVSAGLVKSAAGIYGLLALISVWVGPFLKIGVQYLMLKATAAICHVLDSGSESDLVQDFSAAMGLLLGMTGAICLMLLISTVCFMKGVG